VPKETKHSSVKEGKKAVDKGKAPTENTEEVQC